MCQERPKTSLLDFNARALAHPLRLFAACRLSRNGQLAVCACATRHHSTHVRRGDQPFDAADFLARLEQGVAEQAAVAARRPSGEQLADSLGDASAHLYAWAEEWRKKACLLNEQDPTQTYAWLPLEGSAAAADQKAAAPLIADYCASRQLASYHWLDTNPTRNPASGPTRSVVAVPDA